MKRLLYLSSALVIIGSFGFAGGRTYAAHSSAPMMSVRLCTSTPIGVPALRGLSQGINNGVNLAVSQWKARFLKAHMNLRPSVPYDYARSDGSNYDVSIARQNALQCLGQPDTLALIGTLNSGAALVAEPVLNRGGMAMISPANTSPTLTSPTSRAAQEPLSYSHQLKTVTYFRTVTTDFLQGPAGAIYMNKVLKVSKYFLVDDKQQYGAGLASALQAYATSKLGMTQVGSGHIDPSDAASISSTSAAVADEVKSKSPQAVYCGCDSQNAISFARLLHTRGYHGLLVGGDALFNQTWIDQTGLGSQNNYATSVGPDVSRSGNHFKLLYQRAYPHFAIEAYDATSFDAANVALKAIMLAHSAGMLSRGTMLHKRAMVSAFVKRAHWYGATGLTTFDKNGDTGDRIISIYAVVGNKWVFKGQTSPTGIAPTK